jgi:catechol 2,3-dioxygenase-like lactoylglutathione lyase family enzyme
MLQNFPVSAQLPASDLERAKKFYQETLGFTISQELQGGARLDAGNGTFFWIYPSEFAGTNKATAAAFEVDNVEKVAEDLAGRGIKFEQFDLPYGKTDERGIADVGGWKGAFFKDSEGNIIAIGQVVNA